MWLSLASHDCIRSLFNISVLSVAYVMIIATIVELYFNKADSKEFLYHIQIALVQVAYHITYIRN